MSNSAQPLLSLIGATAEWSVGHNPHCVATVRWLDGVHLEVRAGECVLVHHHDPAGVRILLAALAGHPAVHARPWMRGARVLSRGVRVRRGSIRTDVIAPIVAAWQSARSPRVGSSDRAPVVYLLRASRAPAVVPADHRQWAAWAAAQRNAHGALVVVADERPGAQAKAVQRAAPSLPDGVHEPQPVYREASRESARIRQWAWRHGRLAVVDAANTESQYCWPSAAPVVVDG